MTRHLLLAAAAAAGAAMALPLAAHADDPSAHTMVYGPGSCTTDPGGSVCTLSRPTTENPYIWNQKQTRPAAPALPVAVAAPAAAAAPQVYVSADGWNWVLRPGAPF